MYKDNTEGTEYITTTKKIIINGKSITVNERHPILEQEEKERRHQEFLKCIARIAENHGWDKESL